MTDFIKLNSFQEEHGIYVRTSAVTIIHTNNEGMTKLFVDGIPQPLDIVQSPDEVLAQMGDDAASLPARHVVDHQTDGTPVPLSTPSASTIKPSPQEHLKDVQSRYSKAS